MTFDKYLKKCIDNHGVPISGLTKLAGMNRGKLYNVFEGKRKITEDELFALIDRAGFFTVEADKLIDLYFYELYGNYEFSRIKYLESAIQRDNYTCETCGFDTNGNNIKGSIDDPEQLINSIVYMFYHDREIISNFSYRDKEIDQVVFDCVSNSQTKLTHIMDLSVDEKAGGNLERIFASLKYMYNNSFPVYRYNNIRKMEYNNIFPYYFVGEKNAVLYNQRNGIFIDNADAVNVIREMAVEFVKESTPLGTKTDDVMYIKSLVEKGTKQDGENTSTFTFYPCIAKYVDYDFLYSIAKDEIPEKDMLVNIAFEYYSKIFQNRDYCVITSSKGIELFAEKGYVQEIPAAYVNAANKENRIKVLKNMLTGINDNEMFILDDDKVNMVPGIEIENHSKMLIISGYDFEKENFASGDKYIFSIDDQSIINTLNNFKDYIIHSRKVYPKEYSIKFIQGLIVKLEHMNTE